MHDFSFRHSTTTSCSSSLVNFVKSSRPEPSVFVDEFTALPLKFYLCRVKAFKIEISSSLPGLLYKWVKTVSKNHDCWMMVSIFFPDKWKRLKAIRVYILYTGGDDNEFLPKDAFFGVEAKSMVSKGLLPTFKQIGQAESIVSFLLIWKVLMRKLTQCQAKWHKWIVPVLTRPSFVGTFGRRIAHWKPLLINIIHCLILTRSKLN